MTVFDNNGNPVTVNPADNYKIVRLMKVEAEKVATDDFTSELLKRAADCLKETTDFSRVTFSKLCVHEFQKVLLKLAVDLKKLGNAIETEVKEHGNLV